MLLTGQKSHKGVSPVARELVFKVPVDCCGVWTAEEVQGACLGPLLVLHGGVHAAHWREVTQGCVTIGKRAGPPRYQRTIVGVGTAAVERGSEGKVDGSEAAAYYLDWGSFSILVLLQFGKHLLPALLGQAGHVLV